MRALLLLLPLLPLAAAAQQPHEREIQRAVIQLDERAAGITRPAPEPQVGLPLHPDPVIARELRPYERMKQAEARSLTLRFAPPVVQEKPVKPLPLPRGGEAGVDSVAVPRVAD
jgi:hypothetical protein